LNVRLGNGNGLAISTLNVWVRWCNATSHLVALRIDQAGSSFISGLEADLAFQLLDLFIIEKVAVLISVLDLFLS
jgi:hypothetical protein